MKTAKLILPALTEATSPFFRPIKYSLFPPLGLATLASYMGDEWEVEIVDEHVRPLSLNDSPDLVAIQSYVTNARRAYEIADIYRARGSYVCIGGLHATSLPDEAALHADTIFLGPGEATWPQFLADLAAGRAAPSYHSAVRTLDGLPMPRRDLFRRDDYLVPNSLVVSRGCPHSCDFCYKTSFFKGGRSFYTLSVDRALAEMESLPGRHLYFLDDNLLANAGFAEALFEGMRGMNRVWQAAGTVKALENHRMLDLAARSGLSSLFVGFETLDPGALKSQNKDHNLPERYGEAARALHERDIMINGSFVFGADSEDTDVFDRTVDWAVETGIETATFHILTPYPGTALYQRMSARGRLLKAPWDLFDTRHAVYRPARMSAQQLQSGYWRSYRRFYSWRNILKSASSKETTTGFLRHLAYTGAWKKLEALWGVVIKSGLLSRARPALEKVLDGFNPRPDEDPHRARPASLAATGHDPAGPLSSTGIREPDRSWARWNRMGPSDRQGART